jgi:hypothetical protein
VRKEGPHCLHLLTARRTRHVTDTEERRLEWTPPPPPPSRGISVNFICVADSSSCTVYPGLNMELRSLQSFFGFCVQLYSLAETPATPPLPQHLGSYTRALLVSQDRQHLFGTPCWNRVLPLPLPRFNSTTELILTRNRFLESMPGVLVLLNFVCCFD